MNGNRPCQTQWNLLKTGNTLPASFSIDHVSGSTSKVVPSVILLWAKCHVHHLLQNQ
jgi:hypothetical protein